MELVEAKSILSAGYAKNNPWFGCNYNMNLYRGCCHGCIYCDSRSDCYHIERFDTVRAKKDALLILSRELGAKRQSGVVGMGSMSDPYNPFEKNTSLQEGRSSSYATMASALQLQRKARLLRGTLIFYLR